MKPLLLDWFIETKRIRPFRPFDEAWLMEEYDEVMDIYDLDPEDWL